MIRKWKESINSACDRIDILEKQLASAEAEHTQYMQVCLVRHSSLSLVVKL